MEELRCSEEIITYSRVMLSGLVLGSIPSVEFLLQFFGSALPVYTMVNHAEVLICALNLPVKDGTLIAICQGMFLVVMDCNIFILP